MPPSAHPVVEKFGRAETLMMRIRTLKWQAITIQGRGANLTAREEAGAILADLTSVEVSMADASSPVALQDAEDRVDAISLRMTSIGPRH